jgi:hypothetical protein
VADTAILAAGGGNAPLSYLVPGSTVILLKMIHVIYTDNGASDDWLPAVRIVSDSNHTMGLAADQGVKVTAGNDASVSFFPGVRQGGAGGATVAWAYLDGSGLAPTTVPGDPVFGSPTFLPWQPASFTEDGSGVFSFDPLAPTYIQCSVSPLSGYFLVYACFAHDANVPSAVTFDDVRSTLETESPVGSGTILNGVKTVQSSNIGGPTVPGGALAWALSAWFLSHGDTTPIGFQVEVENFNASGADLNAVSVTFAVSLVAA